TSTVFPVDGSTSILPLTLPISTRPFASIGNVFCHWVVCAARRSAVTMSQPVLATAATNTENASAGSDLRRVHLVIPFSSLELYPRLWVPVRKFLKLHGVLGFQGGGFQVPGSGVLGSRFGGF